LKHSVGQRSHRQHLELTTPAPDSNFLEQHSQTVQHRLRFVRKVGRVKPKVKHATFLNGALDPLFHPANPS